MLNPGVVMRCLSGDVARTDSGNETTPRNIAPAIDSTGVSFRLK